jgi:ribosomal protein S18 acetylase RimI-like enzyme
MLIRPMEAGDLDAAVDLVERRRERLQAYEPVFWRKADGSAETTRRFFSHLVADEQTLFLVAERGGVIVGCAQAREAAVPPVYVPGRTAMIDDFCVSDDADFSAVGLALLRALQRHLVERGFRQIIIACPARDTRLQELLASEALSLTSVWWTKGL